MNVMIKRILICALLFCMFTACSTDQSSSKIVDQPSPTTNIVNNTETESSDELNIDNTIEKAPTNSSTSNIYCEEHLRKVDASTFYSVSKNSDAMQRIAKQVYALLQNDYEEYSSQINFEMISQEEYYDNYIDMSKEICKETNVSLTSDNTINISNIKYYSNSLEPIGEDDTFEVEYTFEIGNTGYGGRFIYFEYYDEYFVMVIKVSTMETLTLAEDLAKANSQALTIHHAFMTALIDSESSGYSHNELIDNVANKTFNESEEYEDEPLKTMREYNPYTKHVAGGQFYIGYDSQSDSFFVQWKPDENSNIIGQYPNGMSPNGITIDKLYDISWGKYYSD